MNRQRLRAPMNPVRASALMTATVLTVALFGCGPKPEQQLTGKWNFQSVQSNGASQAALDAGQKQLAGATASFTEDKKFTLNAQGKTVIEGTWSLSDHQITVVLSSLGGQPVDKLKKQFDQLGSKNPQFASQVAHMFDDMKGSLAQDGKTVSLNPPSSQKGSITFSKA